MKKRVLAALLVTMMTVGVVAGCGSNAKSDDSDKKTSSDSKSDDKKDSGKKVTVVTSGTGEPYSLISDDVKWTGIDAEMWDEIEKRTGWEVEVKQASFDAMWGELDTGRADVVANCLAVKEERTDKFLPDPDVRGAKAYSNDYTKSGYDRGHMAPAADMKWSKQAMAESFYMSNICPQNPNLNRGDWNDLEEKSRQWAKKYGAVYIACGPVYDHGKPKRIGNNKVAVPDAFYKVILINDSKTPQAIGFLFPNKAGHKPLKKYIVTVDSVEKRTGIDFFPALPDEVENRIEAEPAKALP